MAQLAVGKAGVVNVDLGPGNGVMAVGTLTHIVIGWRVTGVTLNTVRQTAVNWRGSQPTAGGVAV